MTMLLAGKYRIERVLGQGGMGVVVAAVHTALDERVAIKLLLPEALANPETVARFQREARAAVRIKSEHVARVTDVGNVDTAAVPLGPTLGIPLVPGAPFMVMEYLEGQDLAAVLRTTGPMPLADAVSYVAQAIEAIAEAHSLGIVHRDLKPSNLFLSRRPDGTPIVKVLDFGISKASIPGAMDAAVTTTSAVLGSPMYMAPEQMISSREVDARTDVWALGVVLYQLLTGRGPFNGTTMTELCARILQEPHSPIRLTRGDVPVEIEAVVARCLEKDRTNRFASVADLAEALAPFGGRSAALSAERARRLLPRTERAAVVPQTLPSAAGPAAPLVVGHQAFPPGNPALVPYAATNPSWSATRARGGGSSGVWVALALGAAVLIACVGVAILVIATRAKDVPAADAPTAEPARTSEVTVPTASVGEPPIVELAPLHGQKAEAPTAPLPPPPTTVHTSHATLPHANPPNVDAPPPHATTVAPKPDIF